MRARTHGSELRAQAYTRARAHATMQLLLTCFQPCESDETAGSAHAEDFEILHNSADGQAPFLSAPSRLPTRCLYVHPPANKPCHSLHQDRARPNRLPARLPLTLAIALRNVLRRRP